MGRLCPKGCAKQDDVGSYQRFDLVENAGVPTQLVDQGDNEVATTIYRVEVVGVFGVVAFYRLQILALDKGLFLAHCI